MADKRRNLGIPSGVVFPFAGTVAPYGYLVCDGSAISRSDYPALFVALGSGTQHGTGDGSTTFNLPDYRGRFMRGVDGTAGRDPDKATRTHPITGVTVGGVVGGVQNDENKLHGHGGPHNITGNPDGATDSTNDSTYDRSYWRGGFLGNKPIPTSGGTESRPKNISVNYIIKV